MGNEHQLKPNSVHREAAKRQLRETRVLVVGDLILGLGAGAVAALDRAAMSLSAWSVRIAWKRWPSASVKESWAPGWGRSRRTIRREPSGQRPRSSRSVISATSPFSRSVPSWLSAGGQAPSGRAPDRLAHWLGHLEADREADPAPCAHSISSWTAAAESTRKRMSIPSRRSAGSRSSAASATAIWSAAVLAPALPRPQHPGGGLRSLVEVGEHRMEAEASLEVPRRSFLLGVAVEVEVDRHPLGSEAELPGLVAGLLARRSRIRENSRESTFVSPHVSATWVSRAVPAWETNPSPPAVTSTVMSGHRAAPSR